MFFQTFHELANYAAAKPDEFHSVSLDVLEEFVHKQRNEVILNDRNAYVSIVDSDTTRP